MSGRHFDVAVVGAGLAGLAAASALAGAGVSVALIDRKPFVGGRAYSYLHPALDEVVDSQHVMVGCCTNLRHLCEQAGLADRIHWYDTYNFMEPGGRRSEIKPGFMPSPAHTSLSFLQAPMLDLADKAAIARGLLQFVRGYPAQDEESVSHWLKKTGQTERAVRHFWQPVIVGALNDTFDRCSMRYAGQVFHETFLKSAEGGRLGIPMEPLSQFYDAVAQRAARQGAVMVQGNATLQLDQAGRWKVLPGEQEPLTADAVVLAVSFEHVASLLPEPLYSRALPLGMDAFRHSPITTVHLWYDRQVTELDHAVLLDATIEWMFHKSHIRGLPAERGSYLELTISASHTQLRQSREEILTMAQRELAEFFPETRRATLRKSGVLKEARATFSVPPGLDRARPAQATAVPNLYLAGDWTSTGWPSTMEGAVRSGYLAAGAYSRDHGSTQHFLQPDLSPAGLMKLFARQPA